MCPTVAQHLPAPLASPGRSTWEDRGIQPLPGLGDVGRDKSFPLSSEESLASAPCSPPAQGRAVGPFLALCPISAQLHPRGWSRKSFPALAEPHFTRGRAVGSWLWDGSDLPCSLCRDYPGPRQPRGAGNPRGTPWPPARGNRDSQSCPPSTVPSSLAGREQGWGRRGERWQSRPLAGAAWPEGPSPEPDPASRSSPASSGHGQRKLGHGRCPNCGQQHGQGWAAKVEAAGRGWGRRQHRDTGPAWAAGPPLCHPSGTEATAVTTISFIPCICTYTV